MGKLLIVLSFVCLLILQGFCYLYPSDVMIGLTSISAAYGVARIGLMAALLALLFTNPPRHKILRVVTGAASIATMLAVAYLTYNNHMNLLDTLAFTAAGVTLGIAALEVGYDLEEVDIEALRQAKISSPLIPKH